jgi:hypothetical protein
VQNVIGGYTRYGTAELIDDGNIYRLVFAKQQTMRLVFFSN